MIGRRQAAFRDEYRRRISPWYQGWAHVALIYAVGVATIWYAVGRIHRPSLSEWLVVPAAFLMSNIFEWWIHRFVMHRPVKGLLGIYKRHTLAHHQFFTHSEPRIAVTRDFRITFFPPYALVTFLAMSAVGASALALVWSENAAWLLICTTAGMYLNYELFHYCCHVGDDRLVRRIPFINTIRRHHIAHHNPAIMMERNMNLTYPIADWLFGTSDLDRGFFGHVFNGYDESRVRAPTRTLRAGSDDPMTARVRV